MPIAIPTPEELARMDWHKRDRVARTLREYERAVGVYVEAGNPRTTRLTDEGRALRAAEIAAREAAWGEEVRAEARRLAGESA
jgi:hypothetical protein